MPNKIPLTIGFANLSGDDLAGIMADDAAKLSDLFRHSIAAPTGSIPSCNVLFLYVHLNDNGTLKIDKPGIGIRQVVQLVKCPILVRASPNPSEAMVKAAGVDGPKKANIVLTGSRNGYAFGTFFRALFEKMRDGKNMLEAWVELAPQGPVPTDPNKPAPGTMLLAEAGKLAFPE